MDGRNQQIKKWLIFALVSGIILFSALGIDDSGLSYFSLSSAAGIWKGLSRPDWGFVYDGSGEDLAGLLLMTLGIAFLGTALATVCALPLTFLSIRIPKAGKLVCNILRAFPELVYAIIFVKMVGPGPFAGALAIGVHQIGMLGKLFTDEYEAMDKEPSGAMTAAGANFWQTMFFADIPQLMPVYSSLSLNHFEIAVRSATTLGIVGAGGIGAPLIFAIQGRNWDKVSIILIGIIFTVFCIDMLAGEIRKKLR
ncbi:phosphonate ABC transporter, permease protein PhnE [Lachnospiraceae bacterium 54-53]